LVAHLGVCLHGADTGRLAARFIVHGVAVFVLHQSNIVASSSVTGNCRCGQCVTEISHRLEWLGENVNEMNSQWSEFA
jgi:hypothetical protein